LSIASANRSAEQWNGEDFVLVELVGESGAESVAAVVERFGAVGIGKACSTAAWRSFGHGSDTAARWGECCAGNSCCIGKYRNYR
jgi:hypothetical protein